MFRGVRRRSSGPGRCSFTVRRRPTSLVAPMTGASDSGGSMVRGWHSRRPRYLSGRLDHAGGLPRRAVSLPRVARSEAGPFGGGVPVDLFDLSGKVAVVTGGTRGIGMMIARGLL